MKRIIALVDCDSFFVSCEQALNQELKGKPVCVVGGERGCVLSRSKEAKKMGIKMGMPYFMAKKEFPNSIYVNSNHSIYKEFSQRVMDVLKEFSPDVEVYSIDEAFVDLTGTRKLHKKCYIDIVKTIREKILEQTDIPVSIGISTSKTLAKLASDKAKNKNGIYFIGTTKIKEELLKTPIEDIWGIGRNISKTLRKKGILNCKEFVELPDSTIRALFGSKGIEMKHELLGETLHFVNGIPKMPKSIQDTSAFGFFSSDKDFLKKEMQKHLHNVCSKLRKYNGYAKSVSVMLRTKDFQVFWEKDIFQNGMNFELEISKKAIPLLEKIYSPNVLYRAVGICLSDITCTKNHQINLFEENEIIDNEKLAQTLDELEEKFGRNIVRTGF